MKAGKEFNFMELSEESLPKHDLKERMVGQGRRKAVVKAERIMSPECAMKELAQFRGRQGMMWLSVDGAGHRAHVTLEFEPYSELQ